MGLGATLLSSSVSLAGEKGFSVAIAEATGPHSHRALQRLGFSCEPELCTTYHTFAMPDGSKPFAQLVDPPKCMFMERGLQGGGTRVSPFISLL